MTIFSKIVLACAIGSALSGPAQAGRPLVTDDAGVLERGGCEVEGARLRAKATGSSETETSVQLTCGIGWSSQLAANATSLNADGSRSRGASLLGKTALWQSEQDAALALAWRLGWDRATGESWRHAATDFNLIYSRPLPTDLTLHANLGHAIDRLGDSRSTTWGIALEHAGFGGLAPMAELFGDDRESAWWNLGLRYTAVPERVFIDASYGRQFSDARTRLWTVGFKLAF